MNNLSLGLQNLNAESINLNNSMKSDEVSASSPYKTKNSHLSNNSFTSSKVANKIIKPVKNMRNMGKSVIIKNGHSVTHGDVVTSNPLVSSIKTK